MCIVYFFCTTANSVLTVHDDILTYMQVRQGALWQTAVDDARHGRICHIPLTFLLYIPYIFDNVLAVRIFSVLSVVFDMTALYLLIKNNIDEKSAYLSSLLFISFACISNQHNLFVAYVIGHQIPIGLILLSLNEFTKYYKKHKTSSLVSSAVLLFSASFLYEASAAYIIIFVLISMYKNKGNIFKNCMRILYDTHFHILFLLLYVIIYFAWRKFYPSDYDGAKLYFGNIPQSMITMLIYSLGLIPGLPLGAMLIKKYITFDEFMSAANILIIIIPLITAVTFYFVFPKIKDCKNKGALAMLCIAGMLTPNLIICFTSKYAEWTQHNSYSYVTSFYSYFFMIPLFLIILKTVFKSDKKLALIFMSLIVFICSAASAVGNTAWNVYFAKNLERYKAFYAAVSDDYFDDIEDGTVVFIPDYQGIHNDMNITKSYASIYTSADITFENDPDRLDFSYPVLCMRYDPSEHTMIIGDITPSFETSNAFYIYGNDHAPIYGTINMMNF